MSQMKNKKPIKITRKPKSPIRKFAQNFWSGILVLFFFVILYGVIADNVNKPEELSISEVAENIKLGKVESIKVEGSNLTLTLKPEPGSLPSGEAVLPIEIRSKKETESSLSETLANYGVTSEQLAVVKVEVVRESGFKVFMLGVFPILLPILLIVFFIWMLTRSVKGQGMQMLNFGQSKAKMVSPEDEKNRITFADVAGAREAKQELEEIVDFLKNPKKFLDIGAKIPKGVLLEGDPGTGKTLLARAVAGEARVPFMFLSGSDFVEMFVGVGASRVRDLFQMAKRASPSIIFIDEIDAVGRKRGSGYGGGNDEREQTLNQILTEMDGFEQNDKVIIIAATNRSDVLDPALLRPGRFDRRVHVDMPDRRDREEILAIHARKKPIAKTVRFPLVAERTHGFSGADLYSLMNESAIRAARAGKSEISEEDILNSIEKVILGPERKSRIITEEERKITAYHEAGHALVASMLEHADPVHKVTIVSRGSAGGYTLHLPVEERRLNSKKEFLDELAMALGGYATEKLIFGDVTTGPSSDLQTVSRIARAMVTKWGMSDEIGPIALEGKDSEVYYGRGFGEKEYSEAVGNTIDKEIKKLVEDALSRATEIIKEKREVLDAIANTLLEKETLEQDEYNVLIRKFGIEPKVKKEKKGIDISPEEPVTIEEKKEAVDSDK